MRLYAPGTFSGNYIPQGDVADADCVIGHEFAYRKTGYGNINVALAKVISSRFRDLPLFINNNIAGALNDIAPELEPEEIFSGHSTQITGGGEGTWGELSQAREAMNVRKLNRPILVAQAHHVGRAAIQAKLLDMEPIIPEDLPGGFDKHSEQIWTRGPVRWGLSQILAAPILRHRSQM